MPLFVLIHSPLVGPSTWSPVAERLAAAGRQVAVPSLLTVGDGGPPYWPRVVEAVSAGLADADADEPLVLVAHSNAGLFIPVLTRDLSRPVACAVFADASIPGTGDLEPIADGDFLSFLRGRVGPDRRLPRWTEWWDEHEAAALFPDPGTRRAITAEQPRLPLAYYLDRVPVPPGWDERACAYLQFSVGYQDQADRARGLGWPVLSLPGGHLHQIVDPDGVTSALIQLTDAVVPS